MGRLIRRKAGRASPPPRVAAPVYHGAAAIGVVLMVAAANARMSIPPPNPPRPPAAASSGTAVSRVASFRRIILPDLLVVAPRGLTRGELAGLRRISRVRNMIAFDGAEIRAGGRPASVIGVDPAAFRSWVPLHTASNQAFWTALAHGDFVSSAAARSRLGLRSGERYRLAGRTTQAVPYGAAAPLGVAGVDLLVNQQVSGKLGLVHRVAALISAPGASLRSLRARVRAILGPSARIVSLRGQQLPVTKVRTSQQPSTYLQLFQESAARYCPGLSWTVLAAIGQIESGDGTNNGPSSAGALGPMQFLPSTWKIWGIDGFGQTGPPDVMNPYDAVPSAARMLCADGAAAGGAALSRAIFDYNHASWYVTEVLALARQYARDYG